MSLKDALYRTLVAEGHDEPVGQLDRLDGVGAEDKGGDR